MIRVLLSAPRRAEAVPNPDGSLAVYTQSSYSFDEHSNTYELRVLDLATGESHAVVSSNETAPSNPQWLEDGDLLVWLEGGENGNTNLVVGDARDAGTKYVAGTVPGPVTDLRITPLDDSKVGFVVSGQANPDGSLYNPETAEKPLSSAHYYTSIWVRHWDVYIEPQRNSLFYGVLQKSSEKGYVASKVANLLADAGLKGVETPIPPFGGTDHFDIHANAVAFVAKDPDLLPATHTAVVLYYIPISSWTEHSVGKAKEVHLKGLKGAKSSPRLSADGKSIVLLAQEKDMYESDKNRIVLVRNPQNGHSPDAVEVFASKDGKGQWDRSPSAVSWTRDNKYFLIQVEEHARVILYRLPVKNVEKAKPHSLQKLTREGSVSAAESLSADSDKLLVSSTSLVENSVYTIVDPNKPHAAKVVSSASDNGKAFGLSRSQLAEFWYKGANGRRVHSWLIKPSNFNPHKKYPLAFLIHGGPEGSWADSWSTRWNPAVFAEQGYVVVAPNPTGSTGFGQAFQDSIQGEWGGLPYIDLERGFDYVRKTFKFVDTDRAVALGASYGGYMVNWIQGHDLGRKFKALVTHDGVFSMTAQWASEEMYFPLVEMKGPLWEVPEEWKKWDPSRFTANWKTPHLIIHNEKDYRLTVAEGLAAFNVLQIRGIDSAFLTFPDENHWVLKPENSLVWHQAVINWINKYVGLPPISTDSPRPI